MDELYDIEFYKNFRVFVKKFMNIVYNIQINGLENIPTDQAYLLVGNHLNILDSWLLLSFIDENLRFMVDKKLYRYKSWEKFFRKLGTFPIDPECLDLNAVRVALSLLKEQEKVVIFPEGKTHKICESVPFKAGISRMSIIANSPIVPFGIRGSYRPCSELVVNVGEPIDFKKAGVPKKSQDEYLESVVRALEKR